MSLRRKLLKPVTLQAYRRISHLLSHLDSDWLQRRSKSCAVRVFQDAAKNSLGYQRFLKEQGVQSHQIEDFASFQQQVPVIDKETVFGNSEFRDWCRGGTTDNIEVFWSSSGHSEKFSFGGDSKRGVNKASFWIEFLLEEVFQALTKRTLVINGLPMGVTVPSRLISQAQTSVRADVIAGLVNKLGGDFDQFIIMGDPLFLKHAIEFGREKGNVWAGKTIHVATGGEFVPETWRSYIAHLLDIDFSQPSTGKIAISMGLSELGLGIFNETMEMIALRREILTNLDLRQALLGSESCLCPEVMLYSPLNFFLETKQGRNGAGELVVTPLNQKSHVPLVRYNTKDSVRLLDYEVFRDILRERGFLNLLPKWHFPVGVVMGRKQRHASLNPLIAKQILFENFELARNLTGVFHLRKETIYLQQRDGRDVLPEQKKELQDKIEQSAQKKIALEIVPFGSYPLHLNVDFERKIRHEMT